MTAPLPSSLGLFRLAVARAKSQLTPATPEGPQPVLVYDRVPPDEETHERAYLIIDPDPGWDGVDRADGTISTRTGRFHVRCIGGTPEQAMLALDAARAAFLNWRPYASLRHGMARETDTDPLTIDRQNPTSPRYVLGLSYEVSD